MEIVFAQQVGQVGQESSEKSIFSFFDFSFPVISSYSGSSSNSDLWARIDNWEEFLANSKKVLCYRSIMPSKKPELIIEHLKKSLQNDYGKGKYDPKYNNCEHFVNLIVHGKIYSSQAEKYGEKWKFLHPFISSLGQGISNLSNSVV